MRLPPRAPGRYTAAQGWTGVTVAMLARQRAAETPDAIVALEGDVALSFAAVIDRARRLAAALDRRGYRRGDVLSFQLPNWHETLVINLAATIGGFVCNPIVPIYRDAEVGFILADAEAKLLFITAEFRGTDYVAMAERLRGSLPALRDIVLVRAQRPGFASLDDWLAEAPGDQDPLPVDPEAVKLLLYTSGTTGKPKGVLHSHQTLRAEIEAVIAFWALSADDRILMPSPVTHITGYLYALELPFAIGAPVVLMERWQADDAVGLIERHGATVAIGATPFLVELSESAQRLGTSLPTFRLFPCGGAPVAPELIARAQAALPGCTAFRIYGSSEAPTVSLGVPIGGPAERGATTDGLIVNHEVRIVDAATGAVLPPGCEGEVVTRGPEVMLGYTDPDETAAAFDPDGFFRTGDLGSVDPDGYLTISGRKKDLIIRGGENLSPREIEDALHLHPRIAEAAVVAAPHPRLGETAAAFVIPKGGATLALPELVAFLEQHKLARQKFPEHLVLVESFPRNAAGKVLKHVLRAQIAAELASR
jgi:acyl-CoA synthetase (AMP-forming)/AMP-acid ligase II